MNITPIVPFLNDPISESFRRVRDATVCMEGLKRAEAIAVLELVKQELINDLMREIHENY